MLVCVRGTLDQRREVIDRRREIDFCSHELETGRSLAFNAGVVELLTGAEDDCLTVELQRKAND